MKFSDRMIKSDLFQTRDLLDEDHPSGETTLLDLAEIAVKI
jgi:hypothetical protein